jgi:protein-tyrosine phosphatase
MTDHDPTRIDLETDGSDPLVARMRGSTVHGDLWFDCPVVTQVTDDLWMGGWDHGLVLPAEVRHLVSLYRWGMYDAPAPMSSFLVVEMYDADEAVPAEQILHLARWVNLCRRDALTLVHCQAGLNRSALVVATALVLEGYEPATAIELLRDVRSPAVLCNPSFERWLLEEAAALAVGGGDQPGDG